MFWFQAGLLYGLASLGYGGYGLQSHLTSIGRGLQAGEYEAVKGEFAAAQDSTVQLDRSLDLPQLQMIGRIAGFSVAVENWRSIVSAASDITDASGGLLNLYGDLSGKGGGPKIFHDGGIDLAMLKDLPDRVTTASDQLHAANTSLQSIMAEAWWAAPLDSIRDRALGEMAPVQQAVESLEGIAPVLPDALGANGVRRYLIAIGNQAEMRAAGGAPLTLVLVEFNEGRISIPIKGPTSTQLFPPLNAPVQWWGPAGNPFFPGNPRDAPFVVTNTHPNLLFSGKEMAEAWVGGDYPPVDGVVTLDLTAIAAMLDATGAVESPVYGTVDGARLGEILLIEAYQEFGQEGAGERQQANQELLDILLERILSGNDLVAAAQAIASTAPGRHFQAWMRNPQLEKLAAEAGAAGTVDDPGTGDWSAAYTQNGNQSKVDVFQQRNVLVTVQLSEDGSAHVSQQMTVTNATPPDRPAEGTFGRIGYETMWLKAAYIMYVPDAAQNYRSSYPTGYAVRPFKNHPQLGRGWVDDGFGHKMIRIVGWTAPGGQNAVTVSYNLPAGTFSGTRPGELVYALRALPQSIWTPSTLTVQVTAPTGWAPIPLDGQQVSGSTATVSAIQSAPIDVRIGFRQ